MKLSIRYLPFCIGVVQALTFAFLMSACAEMGLTVPRTQTFNDQAALVLATANEVVTTTRTLLRAQKIGSDDAENILKGAELAREGVGIARGVAAVQGPVAGTARLRVAADALDAMAIHLQTQGAKP